jgi:hypothetical protein
LHIQQHRKEILLVKLTIVFDESMTEAKTCKSHKYQDLVSEINRQGFKGTLVTVEVDSHGAISKSLEFSLKRLHNSDEVPNFDTLGRRMSKSDMLILCSLFEKKQYYLELTYCMHLLKYHVLL